ncbi:uncharacterized protein UV8b_08084 [Ustilaginoidea virens]|uniref:Uncharacterized protein n=1 Tax=Ustilaginoidea virens TaxID=1159556 RepID=A0A8E5HYW6_USTVR|nr:uncharacterized protein UV8b_08084 [Ustilaginoidea virens]QUC23843.1 hypothetical protein UV8b_08084 [Ustilaginoidea virens]
MSLSGLKVQQQNAAMSRKDKTCIFWPSCHYFMKEVFAAIGVLSRPEGKSLSSTARLDKPQMSASDDEEPQMSASDAENPQMSANDDDEPPMSASDDDEPQMSANDDEEPQMSASDDDEPQMSASDDKARPPPPSQSHFSKFDNFTPDDDASFDHEFARLASSQDWAPGSQEYTQERTIAMREELKLHYFSQPQPLSDIDEELTEEEKLQGYQDLCREVRIPPSDSIAECKRLLKSTLVNIVDLIDARRMRKEVKVWDDFDAFRDYTLQDEHRVNMEEAKKDGGYLASLLQRLGGARLGGSSSSSRRRRRRSARRDGRHSGVISGRVLKERP